MRRSQRTCCDGRATSSSARGTVFRRAGVDESLAALYLEHPDAILVAGATDVGLWITKQLRDLPKIIWLGRVRGLDTDRGHSRTQ